ncbi:MAG: substrate-binding domain-containing protein [Betaproteobacteria bacterium]|nr:substrate-binding domain-containing protein [Betaproteobacteria bacterium]
MSKINIIYCFILLFINLFIAGDALADRQYQVVAHPDVIEKALTVNVLRAIFSMRMRTWSDGQAIKVFVLDDNDALHHSFSKEKLNVFPYQLRLAWDRLVFSGTGQAPINVSSQEEMRSKVASTPGAIGYLETIYIDDDIHVLQIR